MPLARRLLIAIAACTALALAPGLASAPRRACPAGLIDLDAIEAPWIASGSDLRLTRP